MERTSKLKELWASPVGIRIDATESVSTVTEEKLREIIKDTIVPELIKEKGAEPAGEAENTTEGDTFATVLRKT